MFLKELEATLLPWSILMLLLTGDQGIWHWPNLVLALYVLLTEIRYRMAVRESRHAGFKRMVRMPVSRWLLQRIVGRRIKIPQGIKCYTLHVHGRPENHRKFVQELKKDMVRGAKEPALYVGNTWYDLGEFAARQLGEDKVQIIDGTFFGRWLQCWKSPEGHWRIVMIYTSESR